jgi:hypothetical protein
MDKVIFEDIYKKYFKGIGDKSIERDSWKIG